MTEAKAGGPTLPEIKSPRISLRQLTLPDSEELFALIDSSREHLSQNDEDTSEKYPTLESVQNSMTNPSNPNRLRFAIRDMVGKIVGSINLTPEKDDSSNGEMGYYLGANDIGHGYAGEAVRLLTDYGFENLGYTTIYGVVAETNTPSLKVLEVNGYKEEKREAGKVYLYCHKETN